MIKKNTKMKWAVLIFLVLIASLLTWRIYYVNQNVPKVQTEYYDENDSVSMDRETGDETDTKLKNYIVKVESTQLMDKDEFDKKYKYTSAEETNEKNGAYYLVTVNIENKNKEDDNSFGVSLYSVLLLKENGYIILDEDAFKAVNPEMPGTSFALRGSSNMTMTLVYGLNEENGTKVKDGKVEYLKGLMVTETPVRKIIRLE